MLWQDGKSWFGKLALFLGVVAVVIICVVLYIHLNTRINVSSIDLHQNSMEWKQYLRSMGITTAALGVGYFLYGVSVICAMASFFKRENPIYGIISLLVTAVITLQLLLMFLLSGGEKLIPFL
ncbi:MAG: hypothetical protein AAB870_00445 [Patescibacteria group bacterium]